MGKTKRTEKIGLLATVMMGVGYVIGSGIFVMMGSGIASTGRSIWLALVGATLWMMMAYWYQVIMTSMFVAPGGEYDLRSMLFGPLLTGVGGLCQLFAAITISSYGIGLVEYGSMIFPALGEHAKWAEVGFIALFFLCTIRGNKFLSMISSTMTFVMLGAIGLFVVFGLFNMNNLGGNGDPFFLGGFGGFIGAISIMSRATQGACQFPTNLSADVKNPRKNVPLAMLLISLVVCVVYGVMGFVSTAILPVDQVAGKSLAVVAKEIFPNWLYIVFVLGGACFAIATSMLGLIANLRHPTLRCARDGWLPKFFTTTTKSGYPWAVQLLFFLIATLPIMFDFSLVAATSLSMVPMMLMCLALNVSVIFMVKKYPEQWAKSSLHMPNWLFYILCLVGAGSSLIVVIRLFRNLSSSQATGTAIALVVMLAWCWLRLKTGAVDKAALEEKRKTIAARALETTEEDYDD